MLAAMPISRLMLMQCHVSACSRKATLGKICGRCAKNLHLPKCTISMAASKHMNKHLKRGPLGNFGKHGSVA